MQEVEKNRIDEGIQEMVKSFSNEDADKYVNT